MTTNRVTHYVSKDGKKYLFEDYTNNDYLFTMKDRKELPKEGAPYTLKWMFD